MVTMITYEIGTIYFLVKICFKGTKMEFAF